MRNKRRPNIDEAAKAALVQKHQLETIGTRFGEMSNHVEDLTSKDAGQAEALSQLESRVASLFAKAGVNRPIDSSRERIEVRKSLELDTADRARIEDSISKLNFTAPFINSDGDWPHYVRQVEEYAQNNGVNLTRDPFDVLLSKRQKTDFLQRIEEDLEQTNDCDRWDYLIAASCGVLAGLADAFFVGVPGQDSVLGKMTDQGADRLVEKFAALCGWNPSNEGSDSNASAIAFLERKFQVNYDQRHGADVEHIFKMSASNHHLKSLAHSPDVVGLFFSILDQFTDAASFVSDGRLIRIKSNSKLQGGDVASKLVAAFFNWIGHIMSDMAGASGAKGRGSGVAIPFFELLQFADFGNFGKDKSTLAELTVAMYEEGYDARFGAAMAVPVLVNELFIRVLWMLKRRYYHRYEWKECRPTAKHASLRRMLLVGHGCLALVDLTDAAVRGGGEPIQILIRMNFVAWTRFAFLGLREAHLLVNKDARRIQLVEERLNHDIKELLTASRSDYSSQ